MEGKTLKNKNDGYVFMEEGKIPIYLDIKKPKTGYSRFIGPIKIVLLIMIIAYLSTIFFHSQFERVRWRAEEEQLGNSIIVIDDVDYQSKGDLVVENIDKLLNDTLLLNQMMMNAELKMLPVTTSVVGDDPWIINKDMTSSQPADPSENETNRVETKEQNNYSSRDSKNVEEKNLQSFESLVVDDKKVGDVDEKVEDVVDENVENVVDEKMGNIVDENAENIVKEKMINDVEKLGNIVDENVENAVEGKVGNIVDENVGNTVEEKLENTVEKMANVVNEIMQDVADKIIEDIEGIKSEETDEEKVEDNHEKIEDDSVEKIIDAMNEQVEEIFDHWTKILTKSNAALENSDESDDLIAKKEDKNDNEKSVDTILENSDDLMMEDDDEKFTKNNYFDKSFENFDVTNVEFNSKITEYQLEKMRQYCQNNDAILGVTFSTDPFSYICIPKENGNRETLVVDDDDNNNNNNNNNDESNENKEELFLNK